MSDSFDPSNVLTFSAGAGASAVSVFTELLGRATRGEIIEAVVVYLKPEGGAGSSWTAIADSLKMQGAIGQTLWDLREEFRGSVG